MIGSIAYNNSPHLVWAPLSGDAATVFYEGSIVTNVKANKDLTNDGLLLMGAAVGAADTTAFKVPFGIIQGFNVYPGNETYSSGRLTMTAIASSSMHAATAKYLGGNTEHGIVDDGRPQAQVALIDPCTYLKMPIFNGAFGTAITVGTVSTASTTGAGFTSTACCDVAGVAGYSTVYCRTGNNRGAYRVTSDTSTTVKTVYDYFKYDVAIGDTFVGVPFRLGTCFLQLDATATYVEASATPATNYYAAFVAEINLAEAGNEYVIFRFTPDQFSFDRA